MTLFLFTAANAQDSTHKKLAFNPKNPVYEVAATCGTCMFKMEGKGCLLAIKFKGLIKHIKKKKIIKTHFGKLSYLMINSIQLNDVTKYKYVKILFCLVGFSYPFHFLL